MPARKAYETKDKVSDLDNSDEEAKFSEPDSDEVEQTEDEKQPAEAKMRRQDAEQAQRMQEQKAAIDRAYNGMEEIMTRRIRPLFKDLGPNSTIPLISPDGNGQELQRMSLANFETIAYRVVDDKDNQDIDNA